MIVFVTFVDEVFRIRIKAPARSEAESGTYEVADGDLELEKSPD